MVKKATDTERQLERDKIENDEDLVMAKTEKIIALDIGYTEEDFFGARFVGLSISALMDLINYSTVGRVSDLVFKSWLGEGNSRLKGSPCMSINKRWIPMTDYEFTSISRNHGTMPKHVQVKMFLRLLNNHLMTYKEFIDMKLADDVVVDVVYMLKFGYDEREKKVEMLQDLIEEYHTRVKNNTKK